jgi:hypothetical protein
MKKTVNIYGQCVLTADKGKSLTNGEIYTKIYISNVDIDENMWSEIDDADVPAAEEPLDETAAKAAAYDILTGVDE